MTGFSPEKWKRIKTLALRMQAIKNILEVFDRETEQQPFAEELNSVRQQLEADFEITLDRLLNLLDEED